MCVVGKLYECRLIKRIRDSAEDAIGEEQCCFMSRLGGKKTLDLRPCFPRENMDKNGKTGITRKKRDILDKRDQQLFIINVYIIWSLIICKMS